MSRPGVVGVAVGRSREGTEGPCLLVYCSRPIELPSTIEGYPVEQVDAPGGFTVE